MTIRQTQAVDLYRFQMGVGVVATAGALPRVVEAHVTDRETTISIPADAAPASIVFDPNVALFADITAGQRRLIQMRDVSVFSMHIVQ